MASEVPDAGLKRCPFCGNRHPEITSGDSVVCGNIEVGCLGSNTYDGWQMRAEEADAGNAVQAIRLLEKQLSDAKALLADALDHRKGD